MLDVLIVLLGLKGGMVAGIGVIPGAEFRGEFRGQGNSGDTREIPGTPYLIIPKTP